MPNVLKGRYFTPAGDFIGDFVSPLQLTLNQISPGGWASATWTSEVTAPYLGIAEAPPNSKIEIYDPYGLLFRGRMEDPGYQIQAPRANLQLTGHGGLAMLSDRVYTTEKTFVAGTTIDTILKTVRTDLCPDLDTSDALVTPITRKLTTTTTSFIDKRASEVYRQIAALGDASDNPLLWHVWEGAEGTTNKPRLELIPRPTTPTYYVSIAEGAIANINMPLSEIYNRVIVRYANGTARLIADDTVSQGDPPAGYGLRRDLVFDAAQIAGSTDAGNIANVLLSRTSTIRARGQSIDIPASTIITDENGGMVPPQRVRVGRMIEIRDLSTAGIFTAQYRFVIAALSYRDADGRLSVTPEQIDPTVAALARLSQITTAA